MAIEPRRACNFRKIGAYYLVGPALTATCDRIPLAIPTCSTCGETLRPNRGYAIIKPNLLWGLHGGALGCPDRNRSVIDPVCTPPDRAYLMWVGERYYTPESFLEEARQLGVSKRIRTPPKGFVPNLHWVFLAHRKAIPNAGATAVQAALPLGLPEVEASQWKPGVFCVFMPTAIELIVSQEQANNPVFMLALNNENVRPVVVPTDDLDHQGPVPSGD